MDGYSYGDTGSGGSGHGTGGYPTPDPGWAQQPQKRTDTLPPVALVGLGVIAVLIIAIAVVLVTGDDRSDPDVELSREDREAVDLRSALLTNDDVENGLSGVPPPTDDSFEYQGGPECADLIRILSRDSLDDTPGPDAENHFGNEDDTLLLSHSLSWTDAETASLADYREAAERCPELTFVDSTDAGEDSTATMEPIDLEPIGDAHLALTAEYRFSYGTTGYQTLILWEHQGLRSSVSYSSTAPDELGPEDLRERSQELAEIVDPRIVQALGA